MVNYILFCQTRVAIKEHNIKLYCNSAYERIWSELLMSNDLIIMVRVRVSYMLRLRPGLGLELDG